MRKMVSFKSGGFRNFLMSYIMACVILSSLAMADESKKDVPFEAVNPSGQVADLWKNGREKLEEAKARLKTFQEKAAVTLGNVEAVKEWYTGALSEFESFLKEFGANSELTNTINALETEFSVRVDELRHLADSGLSKEVADEYREMADGYDTLILQLKDYGKGLEKSRNNAIDLLTRFAQHEELMIHRVRYHQSVETVKFLGEAVSSFETATKAWSDILDELPSDVNPGLPN